MTTTTAPTRDRLEFGMYLRRNAWLVGLWVLLAVMLLVTWILQPGFGPAGITALALASLAVGFAAAGQAIAVLTGGIDLSIASMIAVASVAAARGMEGASDEVALLVVLLVLAAGVAMGTVNGVMVVATRVPDIIVTLAMMFVWAGTALLITNTPGGAAAPWFRSLASGTVISEWLPRALVLLLVVVGVVWLPLRRSIAGLSIYAVGSDRLAAQRSGVAISRAKIIAYALTGLFAAAGGLAVVMNTGQGNPVPGPYLLLSVAAVVLGGVSLAGGRGGLVGPLVAVLILRLVRTDLVLIGVDPGYASVIEGAIMVGVVMIGAALTLRRART